MRPAKIIKRVGIGAALAAFLLTALVWSITFHPRARQSERICGDANAPLLKSGQTLKILSWNVQFMAGKGYLFFFEMPNDAGPDERPTAADIARTTDEVARIIREEDPDIILLQEIDDDAKRTDHADQLRVLLSKLPSGYCCHTSTFYWKAKFIPHRRIMGSVGMKLSTISKYRISSSVRHALPTVPHNLLVRQFHPKRAILEARLPIEGGRDLAVLNLHLDAFSKGTDVLQQQVEEVDAVLSGLSKENYQFVAGGDFNLLPPGQRDRLPAAEAEAYRETTEMALLYEKFQVIPSLANLNGPESARWLTHFPNTPGVVALDRTIDYLVLSPQAQVLDAHVRQHDTQRISDHLPVITVLQLD